MNYLGNCRLSWSLGRSGGAELHRESSCGFYEYQRGACARRTAEGEEGTRPVYRALKDVGHWRVLLVDDMQELIGHYEPPGVTPRMASLAWVGLERPHACSAHVGATPILLRR